MSVPAKRKLSQVTENPPKKLKINSGKLVVSETNLEKPLGYFPNDKIRLASWNVNGIRACSKKPGFLEFIAREDIDILCFNETKLQEQMVPEFKKLFQQFPFQYWNCSLARKGYSGVSLLSKVEPISVRTGIGKKDHDQEGRVVTAEFNSFFVVSTYIPNAGQKLKRLDYRVKEWDLEFRAYLNSLYSEGKGVIWVGDLNVIHQEMDIYNIKGKEKNAGVTPQERQSFSETLAGGWKDTFRELYPEAKKYSWFSALNASRREKNEGWRLDYIVVDENFMPRVLDSLIHDTVMGSDHHPVELVFSN